MRAFRGGKCGGERNRVPTLVLAWMLLAGSPALALNPSLDISQYAHTAWRLREGFVKGAINAIAQTPYGYLWLGTEVGLLRFDGVRTVPWVPQGQQLPSSYIARLLTTRDGRLWIGTFAGLASWKDGRLTTYPELAGRVVAALLEDHQGTTWVGGMALTTATTGRLCAIQSGSVRCYGEDGSLGRGVLSLYEYRNHMWAGAESGLWRWRPEPPARYPLPGPLRQPSDLIEGDNGALWLALPRGIWQLVDAKVEPYQLQPGRQLRPYRFLRDREGGLWIGTFGQGILHVHQGRTEAFTSADGLTSDSVTTLFEDHEGNVWAGTEAGLDRFREFVIPTISFKQGLSSALVSSVTAARDGSVWLGTPDGLNRWRNGQVTIYRKRGGPLLPHSAPQSGVREITDSGLPDYNVESTFQDAQGRIWVPTRRGVAYFDDRRFVPVNSPPGGMAYSIAEESAGNLWISEDQGLFHFRNGRWVEQIPWARLGHKDYATALVPDAAQGGLWFGFAEGGLAYFKDGQVRASFREADGLGKGKVHHLRFDRKRALWAATEGGLSRLHDGRIATLTGTNGLPCDAVQWMMEDDAQSVWLNMACGLVRMARAELSAWVADSNHIVSTTVFDSSDGVRSRPSLGDYSPLVAKSLDGKLWFLTYDGVSVTDPSHLPFNRLPPPVHIEQIIADHKTYDAASVSSRHLPPLARDLQIDYTALSLVAPEMVRFRYKLEGHDNDWQNAGTRRQAFYNDLPPRHYRFRVVACNNSGVWNEAGASFDFSIDPAYYQTHWFQASCVAAFLALLVALYQLRLRYLKQRFHTRLEARVAERTRIARELHDTLLQSFQGVLMKFHSVTYLLPDRPGEARDKLEAVIEQARAAVTEGRDAVQGLRSSTVIANNLAQSISALGAELVSSRTGESGPEFRVQVEGKSRDLPPLVRDEVNRVACEAVRNAFLHSQARHLQVEIRYEPRQFRLLIRDDGKGIDQKLLDAGGREGHHGLPGMRERAQIAGGKLAVFSRPASGTDIELTIPAALAYAKTSAARQSNASGQGS